MMCSNYFEKRFFGRHYDWPECPHRNVVRERDRRAAEIKTNGPLDKQGGRRHRE